MLGGMKPYERLFVVASGPSRKPSVLAPVLTGQSDIGRSAKSETSSAQKSLRRFLALSAVVASSLVAGCAQDVVMPEVASPGPMVCGGAVCFEEREQRVARWGSGRIDVIAVPIDVDDCSASARAALSSIDPQTGEARDGDEIDPIELAFERGIRVVAHGASTGDVLPVESSEQGALDGQPHVTAHAWRMDPATQTLVSDEEAVSGEAEILEVDETGGIVRMQVLATWTSGVRGDLSIDVEGPGQCADPT
jgi:hypothetical protein